MTGVQTCALPISISLFGIKDNSPSFILGIAILLWFTVIFANFAEAIAEGRGKAQADSLRASKKDVVASKIDSVTDKSKVTKVNSSELRKGDLIVYQPSSKITNILDKAKKDNINTISLGVFNKMLMN